MQHAASQAEMVDFRRQKAPFHAVASTAVSLAK